MAGVSWLLMVGLAGAVCADSEPLVYFREQFEDGDGWQKRWIESKHKSDFGKFRLTSGKFFGDEEKDKGLQTSEDAKFYAISSRFEPFTNDGQTLVIQFTVKHEQNIDCGGGYVKLLPSSLKQDEMHGNSTYYIMFGPDICGTGNKKVHVIFNYKEKNHLINKDIRCKDDEYTHLYTLIVRSDNTYEVKIDNANVESGSLEEDWDFLPAKRIIDPNATKPEDWDEREQIDDPDDKRPEDWEEIEHIIDPDARRPDDWDEEMDGEWEPAMIINPKYKGIWKPKRIDNPNFKGEWVQPEIDNPEYVPDPNIYRYENIGVIGLDLWQVKSGTIFDNFLITNDEELAENIAKETWGVTTEAEKKMKESQEEEDKKNQEKDKESKVEKKADEMEEEEEVEEVVAEEEEEEVGEDEEAREKAEDEEEKIEEDEEEIESQPKDEL